MTAPEGAPFDTDRVELAIVGCLNAIVSAAANFSTPVVLPSRQIAGAGLIPYDCEQVFATVVTLGTGTPEPGRASNSGVGTWPGLATGANYTLFNATVSLGIVRKSIERVTGLGQIPPTPAAYLSNLGLVSSDVAVLWAAISQIQELQSSAAPTSETTGPPQGGLIATTARITILI